MSKRTKRGRIPQQRGPSRAEITEPLIEVVPTPVRMSATELADAMARVVRAMRSGHQFTTDDLREALADLTDGLEIAPQAWGLATRQVADLGLARKVGYQASRRGCRHGGVLAIWQRTARINAPARAISQEVSAA